MDISITIPQHIVDTIKRKVEAIYNFTPGDDDVAAFLVNDVVTVYDNVCMDGFDDIVRDFFFKGD
jgi:hypothetical protein